MKASEVQINNRVILAGDGSAWGLVVATSDARHSDSLPVTVDRLTDGQDYAGIVTAITEMGLGVLKFDLETHDGYTSEVVVGTSTPVTIEAMPTKLTEKVPPLVVVPVCGVCGGSGQVGEMEGDCPGCQGDAPDDDEGNLAF